MINNSKIKEVVVKDVTDDINTSIKLLEHLKSIVNDNNYQINVNEINRIRIVINSILGKYRTWGKIWEDYY